jgi:hypothetical protein
MINQQTFNQLVRLSPNDMHELICTILASVKTREDSEEAKIIFGSFLMQGGIHLFESARHSIDLSIQKQGEDDSIHYHSGEGSW